MILLDASVLLAAEDADDRNHSGARGLLESGHDLATIDLASYEVVNVAISRWKSKAAAVRLMDRVTLIEEYGTLVRADRALTDDAAECAEAHAISAYDAGYVAAARRFGATLASCDEKDLVGPGLAKLPGDIPHL